ncbi:transporter, partial [bacterium]
QGFGVVLVGAVATIASALVIFIGGRLILRASMNVLMGIYAGSQTQPIALSFAAARTGTDLPAAAYAGVFPIAVVLKIVVGQILYALFR